MQPAAQAIPGTTPPGLGSAWEARLRAACLPAAPTAAGQAPANLAAHAEPMRAPAAGFDTLLAPRGAQRPDAYLTEAAQPHGAEPKEPALQTDTLQASIAAHAARLTAQLAVLPTEELIASMRSQGMLPPTAGTGQPTRAEAIAWLVERVARAPPLHPEVAKDLEAMNKLPYEELVPRMVANGLAPARDGMAGPAPPQDGVGVLLSEFLVGQTASTAPPAPASACFTAEELAWMRVKCQGMSAIAQKRHGLILQFCIIVM
jgi:hypothetical protein